MIDKTGKFWMSRKFWYVIFAISAFLALALTKTMDFTPEQTIEFLLVIFGLNIGAHTLTDISSVIGQFFGKNRDSKQYKPVKIEVDYTNGKLTPPETPVPKGVYPNSR